MVHKRLNHRHDDRSCRFQIQCDTGIVLQFSALDQISVNSNSVSIETAATIPWFQLRFIDRRHVAIFGAVNDRNHPSSEQPNAAKSLAPQHQSAVGEFCQHFSFDGFFGAKFDILMPRGSVLCFGAGSRRRSAQGSRSEGLKLLVWRDAPGVI
jgi:hypothetical protein